MKKIAQIALVTLISSGCSSIIEKEMPQSDKPSDIVHTPLIVPIIATQDSHEINESKESKESEVFSLREGETLKESLTRWIEKADYNRLVYRVVDKSGELLRIPIAVEADFRCDFKECLRQLKEAYARAEPSPLNLKISVLNGNKIVHVRNEN